jgi:6-phosphogluconolactonase
VLNDERLVPETSSRSNTRLIRERLLVEKAAVARFVSFIPVTGDPSDVDAEAQSEAVRPWLPITTLILGMGDDMHTASLFPGDPSLNNALASDAPLLCPVYPEGQPTARVTLPAHVLDGALNKHLVIFGDEKRAALERAEKLSPEEAPIAAVLDEIEVYWAA